jgi:hypothetical protein
MSSILPQFQYFKFTENAVSYFTPEKCAIVIPSAPVKTKLTRWTTTEDDYDTDNMEHPYCLVHPAHQEWAEPMTLSELALDSEYDDDEISSLDEPMTLSELALDSEYDDDEISSLDEPMTLSELALDSEYDDEPMTLDELMYEPDAHPCPNVTTQRGVSYCGDDDEDSLLYELMSETHAHPCPNVTTQRGVSYCGDDDEDSLLGETMTTEELITETDNAHVNNLQSAFDSETCSTQCGFCYRKMQHSETYEFDCGHSLCYECFYLEFFEETDGVCPVSDCKKHVKKCIYPQK